MHSACNSEENPNAMPRKIGREEANKKRRARRRGEALRRENSSPNAIERRKRYQRSPKGKETLRRYGASPKGQMTRRAADQAHRDRGAKNDYVKRNREKRNAYERDLRIRNYLNPEHPKFNPGLADALIAKRHREGTD